MESRMASLHFAGGIGYRLEHIFSLILITVMTEQEPRPHVRITQPEEVLSIIPLTLAFQPGQDDLVMLGLGERGD
jgi:thiamine pyrophosphokinase